MSTISGHLIEWARSGGSEECCLLATAWRETKVRHQTTREKLKQANLNKSTIGNHTNTRQQQLNKCPSMSTLLLTALLTLANLPDAKAQFLIKNQQHTPHQQYQTSPSDEYHRGQHSQMRPALFQLDASVPSTASSVIRRSQNTNSASHHQQDQNYQPSHQYQYSHLSDQHEPIEARGSLSRNIYAQSLLRGARNVSFGSGANSASSSSLGSWHFPRISPEQAAEVLLTGAQVINRIAQADSQLNNCKTPDNQDGECSDIRKCIWLVLDKARLKQSVCLRNLIIPAVCCPISSTNNTQLANMIQSTLEPVLFRPKAPKQKKYPMNGNVYMKPFANIVNKTIVGSPPPSPASLIIRNKPALNLTSSASTEQPTKQQQSGTETSSLPPGSIPSNELLLATNKPYLFSSGVSSATTTVTSTSTTTGSSVPANTLFSAAENNGVIVHSNNYFNRTLSQKYPWANETCGEGGRTRTGRIVGGSDSKLGQWPWMTAMYLNKRGPFSSPSAGGEFWCGGALINRRFILTAAHCLSDQRGNRYKNDQVTIKLGGVDLVRHQAPLDILRNGEIESRSSSQQSDRDKSQTSAHRRSFMSPKSAFNQHGRADDDEEEFSWTSFITKALGLGGGSSSTSNSGAVPQEGSTKSLSSDKKQQLAEHAKKTYFKEYKVANIKQHPKFQRHGFYNDIGLIELKSDVEYDDLISPVCLPTEHDLKRDMSGYMATVLGWGTLSYGGQGSKLLQQVAMPIWNNKDCDDRYLQHIGKTFVCAGFLTGGKDACQGDSGGPLMVGDKSGRWTLHGVVSFGKTCAQAGYPGVYTRVTEYLDWIRDNTDPNGYAISSSITASPATTRAI